MILNGFTIRAARVSCQIRWVINPDDPSVRMGYALQREIVGKGMVCDYSTEK
jgi:hypothetical protein